jgi:DNA-binding MarR family transcriptional regulator
MTDEKPWYDTVFIPALLRHARTTYGGAMRRALNAAGYDDIPGNGLYVIGSLALEGFPLSQIIRQMNVSKQAGGQLVDALVLRGYLDRTVDPEDRRKLNVTLTNRGRAAAAVQSQAREKIDAELLQRVGEKAIGHARQVLGTLIEMGREDENEPD